MTTPYRSKTVLRQDTSWLFDIAYQNSQSPPFNDRMYYVRRVQTVRQINDADGWKPATNIYLYSESSELWNPLVLRLRDKLREKCGPAAMAAVNIKERQQSFDMIGNRAYQFLDGFNHLRRGNLLAAARTLRVTAEEVDLKKANWLHRKKRYGDAWLEFHFGWKPLVSDIFSGIDLLQQPYPSTTVKVRGKDGKSGKSNDRWYDTIVYQGQVLPYPFGSLTTWEYVMKLQMIADLNVTNPNLYLANQLGLINPAQVLWEMIPYSFLVDWFLPVGSFLNQFTDFSGMSLGQPMTTTLTTRKRVRRARANEPWDPPFEKYNEAYATEMYREKGIYSASFPMPSVPMGLSPTRAATAISLILQQLRR